MSAGGLVTASFSRTPREAYSSTTGRLCSRRCALTQEGHTAAVPRNSQGQGSSNTLFLNFQYAPVCRRGQQQVYGAASNQPVRVNCEVQSEPAPTSFHWRLGNESLTNFTSFGHTSHANLGAPPRAPRSRQKAALLGHERARHAARAVRLQPGAGAEPGSPAQLQPAEPHCQCVCL
ncbi:hypothetical protein MRX96_040860 [Rhipicephalus microplus]